MEEEMERGREMGMGRVRGQVRVRVRVRAVVGGWAPWQEALGAGVMAAWLWVVGWTVQSSRAPPGRRQGCSRGRWCRTTPTCMQPGGAQGA